MASRASNLVEAPVGALASASETAVDLVSSELLLPAARVRKHQKGKCKRE